MTKTIGPDPNQIYPLHPYNKLVFLKNFVQLLLKHDSL